MSCKHILYLASGSSRRFGDNKLLYPIDGKPMFLHGLQMLKRLTEARKDCTLTVVSRYAPIRQAAWEMGVPAVDSPDSQRGISHTIRAGLNALASVKDSDFLVFVVADQPFLTENSVARLLDQAEEGTTCASLCYGNRPGNPTLFSARLKPELLALEGDTGGRAVLKKHPCVFVTASSLKELEDIDSR